MYVTEKYLKMEIKELREQNSALAADLGGDIRFLHQEIVQLQEQLETIKQVIAFTQESEANE